ncbi:hypothetical protein D7X74_07725 [Corallococcus sp. CA047B]|uniref:hypothetical protein n=1 Tax=Corallococcus sp. CA047B TaxID=2316729 RepID=UPI000EA06D88|nr:hypothetical protein [Corallococcus sp. CA047B]RKH19170.1 hypothetical protein D7X74_07725 [Corallococcus sp. CA047B]
MRGATVAQYRKQEPRSVALNLRITKTADEQLLAALKEEQKEPSNAEMSRAELGALIWDDGLDIYAARTTLGPERFTRLTRVLGDQRAVLTELLRRGLDAMEEEQGFDKPPKKGGR